METRCIGSKRDMLIHVLEEEMKARAKPCQSPDFSCYIGEAALYRNGIISVPDDREYVLITLSKLGLCDYPYETDAPEAGSIAYTTESHSGTSLMNLFCILSARYRLLNQALNAKNAFYVDPELMNALLAHPPVTLTDFLQALYGKGALYRGIQIDASYIVFSGFQKCPPEEIGIHQILADRLIDFSLTHSWAKPFTKNVRNRKYAFRTWLNELGFIGPEYEELRHTLLSRLPGRSDQKKLVCKEDIRSCQKK